MVNKYCLRFFTQGSDNEYDEKFVDERLIARFESNSLPLIPMLDTQVFFEANHNPFQVCSIVYSYPYDKEEPDDQTFMIDVFVEEIE